MRLFCFPCVGSSLSAYRDWQAELPRGLDWCPIELPGNEPLDTLVPAAADALTPWLDGEYAFFGHSLGGLVAFELARELRRRSVPAPRRLFLAGITPPRPRDADRPRPQPRSSQAGLLDDAAIVRGLPMPRADLSAIESWRPRFEPPLSIPIAAFAGAWDAEAPPDAMAAWRDQTDAGFQLTTFAGDHFFLHGGLARRALIGQIGRALFERVRHAA